MSTREPAVIAAMVASVGFSSGLVLQAIGVSTRAADEPGDRSSSLWRLVRSRWWLSGTAIVVAAQLAEFVALHSLPAAVVVPIIAAGIVVVPLLERALRGTPIGAATVLAMAFVALGVALVQTGVSDASRARPIAGAAIATALVGAATLGIALTRRVSGVPAAVLAGIGLGMSGALFGIAAPLPPDRALLVTAALGGVVCGLAGFALEMRALESLPATACAPVVLVGTVVVPTLVAPLIVRVPAVSGVAAWGGVVLIVLSASYVASSVERARASRVSVADGVRPQSPPRA